MRTRVSSRLPGLVFLIPLLLAACGDDAPVGGSGPPADSGSDANDAASGDSGGQDTPVGGCVDGDQDGYGENCELGPDCDDGANSTHSGAAELCDGTDNDCDEAVDEDCPCTDGAVQECYTGQTGSAGIGPCRTGFQICEDERWGNCTGQVTPVNEICDRRDNNCNGAADEGLVNACGTCGDTPAEVCGDGLDNDCDGVIDQTSAGCDCDGRTAQPCYGGPPATLGVGVCRGGRFDCGSDGNWGACRGQVLPSDEICDGLDNDCDGFVDDGLVSACGQCGGDTPAEVCDGDDNDCDGFVDEGLLLVCGQCTAGGEEACGDGFDGDCDGEVDEGCACVGPTDCYPGPPQLAGEGACTMGTRSCDPSGEFWGACTGFVLPRPEVCDDVDNDCDGTTDLTPLGCSVCATMPETCDGTDEDCDGLVDELLRNSCGDCLADVQPEEDCGQDCCNGEDDDCDGLIDEGLLNACGTCGESCYVESNTPDVGDDIGEGGELIPANDPDNPTGRPGITLASHTVIPPYLWVANHDFDTVSRFNTETLEEEGRYWVGDNPSRTGVDLDGNVWIGGRDDGRLTKVLWDRTSCPDRNSNGVIDTAGPGNLGPLNSPGDPLADECVAYSAVPNAQRPSIRGSAPGPDGRIWIGYSGGGIGSIDPHTFELGPFVPASGVPLYAPDVSGVQQPLLNGDGSPQLGDAGGVYGLVVDSRGHLYTSSYNRDTLPRFDTTTGQWVALYTQNRCGAYGIAVDAENRVWLGGWPGCRGIGMFDPDTERLHNFAVPVGATITHGATSGVDPNPAAGCGSPNFCVTGLAAEPATGDIWASFYGMGYTGRLHVNEENYAASTWTYIGTAYGADGNLLPGVGTDLRGVGFDQGGYAWTIGLGSGRVWMLDPDTNARAAALPDGLAVGVGTHYTYSDFTGSTALSFTAPRSFWSFRFDTGYANAQPDRIVWEAYVPEETEAGIRIRVLDADGDPIGQWAPPPGGDGSASYADYPTGAADATFDLAPYNLDGQVFEVEVRLATSDSTVKPIVHEVNLFWQRP